MLPTQSDPVRFHWPSFILGLLGAGLVAGLFFLFYRRPEPPPIVLQPPPTPPPTATAEPTSTPAPIVVYLSGAVQQPGLYHVAVDARVGDVLALGGGLREDATADTLNLAARVWDGAHVHVAGRPADAGSDDATASVSEPPTGILGEPGPAPGSSPPGNSAGNVATVASGGSVNVNTASQSELESLPSIGPSRAGAIIDNRPYATVDDLLRVPGIGEGILAQLRDLVTVE